ncbi:MAG TPA: hypothetical protein VJU58_13785 [Microbacterium sp.]|nr:hypothetical protein [Microbacterium sp.]
MRNQKLKLLVQRYADARVQSELAYATDKGSSVLKRCDDREKSLWAELESAIEALQ